MQWIVDVRARLNIATTQARAAFDGITLDKCETCVSTGSCGPNLRCWKCLAAVNFARGRLSAFTEALAILGGVE